MNGNINRPAKKSLFLTFTPAKAWYIFLFILCFPFFSRASGYWLDIKGSGEVNTPVQIQVCYGIVDKYSVRHRVTGNELTLVGEFKIMVVDEKGHATNVVIRPKADCWEGTFIPAEKGVYQVLGINDTHPVVDRSKSGGKNVLPIDYLCADYHAGSSNAVPKPVQFLDIRTFMKGKLVVIKAFNNGMPAGNTTKLRVFNPENWEKELQLDEAGEAVFMPTMKGLYVVRQDWDDPKSGTYKGVSYTSIRYRCNYCLQVN